MLRITRLKLNVLRVQWIEFLVLIRFPSIQLLVSYSSPHSAAAWIYQMNLFGICLAVWRDSVRLLLNCWLRSAPFHRAHSVLHLLDHDLLTGIVHLNLTRDTHSITSSTWIIYCVWCCQDIASLISLTTWCARFFHHHLFIMNFLNSHQVFPINLCTPIHDVVGVLKLSRLRGWSSKLTVTDNDMLFRTIWLSPYNISCVLR